MTDDLVKRLRFGVALDEQGDVSWCNQEAMFKAADRIEKLETALRKIAVHHRYNEEMASIARKALDAK